MAEKGESTGLEDLEGFGSILRNGHGRGFVKLAVPAMNGMMEAGAIFVGQLVSPEAVGDIVVAFNMVSIKMALAVLFATFF